MPIELGKYINSNEKNEKNKSNNVWVFVVGYVVIQFLLKALEYGVFVSFFIVIISWIPILFVPCLLHYGLKKTFTKKQALVYSVLNGLILLLCNVVIDIYVKTIVPDANTTTVWNLLMMVVPYYILSGNAMFSINSGKN